MQSGHAVRHSHQSYCPATYQLPGLGSYRRRKACGGCATIASYSSASHCRPSHQYPLDCHEPVTSPSSSRSPFQKRREGAAPRKTTFAGWSGRNRRKAERTIFDFGDLSIPPALGWNGPIRNSSSRWLLHKTGEPTFASPTIDLSRARRRSSLSGSGNCAWNRPRCDTCGTAGSAESVTPRIPACGGSACSYRFKSLRSKSLF